MPGYPYNQLGLGDLYLDQAILAHLWRGLTQEYHESDDGKVDQKIVGQVQTFEVRTNKI